MTPGHIRNLPLKLMGLAVIIVLLANIYELQRTANGLRTTLEAQDTALAGSPRIEAQLTALARGTRQLADGGNANARSAVATLGANGVNIN